MRQQEKTYMENHLKAPRACMHKKVSPRGGDAYNFLRRPRIFPFGHLVCSREAILEKSEDACDARRLCFLYCGDLSRPIRDGKFKSFLKRADFLLTFNILWWWHSFRYQDNKHLPQRYLSFSSFPSISI